MKVREASTRPRPGTAEWRTQVLEQYPRAYEPWGSEEDQQLRLEFAEGQDVRRMSECHQRRPGGIKSRLRHLALTGPAPDVTAEQLHRELRQMLHAVGNRSRTAVIASAIERLDAAELATRLGVEHAHARVVAERSLDRVARLVLTDGTTELRACIARAGRAATFGEQVHLVLPDGTKPNAELLLIALSSAIARVAPGHASIGARVTDESRAPLVQRTHGRT